jgi:hypothetical protein
MTAVVMRQFDDAIDFSLPASTASSSRGGDGRRVSTGFVEGRGERRGKTVGGAWFCGRRGK